jgi:hypothetical protein
MNARHSDLDRMVAGIAPDAGPGMTEGARDLLEEIVATEPAARPGRFRLAPRLSPLLAAGLAALVMMAGWLVPGVGPGQDAAAPVELRREGDEYVVRVKDLFAETERYEAALRAEGLNISLKVVPTSPNMEGSAFMYDRNPKSPHPVVNCAPREGCQTVRIPIDHNANMRITLGRKARPGESYKGFSSLDAKGEPLHCVRYVGKTVAEVRELLRQRGVFNLILTDGQHRSWTSVLDSWYVHEGFMSGPGRATLLVTKSQKRPDVPGPNLAKGNRCG